MSGRLAPFLRCAVCREREWMRKCVDHEFQLLTDGELTFDEALAEIWLLAQDEHLETDRGGQHPEEYAEIHRLADIAVEELKRAVIAESRSNT